MTVDASHAGSDARFDAVVLGAGQAGPGVATHLAAAGHRVAIVEADKVGGTCLNRGCRPTKALRASAKVAHTARQAAVHGVSTGDVSVDFAAAMARKDTLIDGWVNGFDDYLHHVDGVELIRGQGRFTGRGDDGFAIEVGGGRTIGADQVFVNVGARPFVPPIDGLRDTPFLDNDSVLHLDRLPAHLVILGGSYIGLELAQIFARFGSRVTVLEQSPHLLPREDPDIADEIRRVLTGEQITIECGIRVVHVAGAGVGDAASVSLRLDDGRTVDGSHLLVAVGRAPNSDWLGLEAIGLATDERGYIPVDGYLRTAVDGVWAMGDVNGRGAFTHTAYQDHEIVVGALDALAAGRPIGTARSIDERVITYALFTDPPLGRVGLTEAQVRAAGIPAQLATFRMDRLTKAILDGETDGLIKILVHAETGRFLGAACLGLFGDEIVQIVSALIHADAPCHVLREMLPIHPTVAEFWPTILAGLEPLD